ncbi:MAG: radical SAM protein [Myxococcota bacterium]|nr:radical SAM protein [Myxococcota bacterium]
MRYDNPLFRPPSEARSYILQATLGCSWNKCTYCAMYRTKEFRIRSLKESLEDLDLAHQKYGPSVDKIFVADGDALIMNMDHWVPILEKSRALFPKLRRVSAYAMAPNILEKSDDELARLRELGLSRFYIGPESGDDKILKQIAKGDDFQAHVDAAQKAKRAGIELSVIALLGIGGDRAEEHARNTGKLITEMDPEFFSALTVTVVPNTPLAKQEARGKFKVPEIPALLQELQWMVMEANPNHTVFRTNHASNYLPLAGNLPEDRDRIVDLIEQAVRGELALRPEWLRGL